MIKVTKISGEMIAVNDNLIELIEVIPESKLVMTNGKFYIVKETVDEIFDKIIEYQRRIFVTIEKTVCEKNK